MANYSDTEGEIFEVDYLLDHRGRGKGVEYLVRWRGFGEEEDSWEPVKNLGNAEEAVLAYRAKNVKTPRRQSRGRDGAGDATVAEVEKSTSKTKSGTVTKTVIKTQTITKTEAKNTQSESSSPEASPTVTRRSLRTRKTEETEVKKADSNDTKKRSDGPSRLASLTSMLTAPCRMCHCVRLGTKDIPIMILVTCLLVIASSFYIAGK